MYKTTMLSLACPHCKNKIKLNKYEAFQKDSNDMSMIFDDSLVKYSCPLCHNEIIIVGHLVFYDLARKIVIVLIGAGENEKAVIESINKNFEGFKARIINTSYADFKEKVLIMESNLNDIACEIYKNKVLNELNIDHNDLKSIHIVITRDLKPIGIVINAKDYSKTIEFSESIYYDIKSKVDELDVADEYYNNIDTIEKARCN